MGLIDSWTHRAVYRKARASFTDAGEPSFGTAAAVRAVVRPWKRLVRDKAGQMVESHTTLFVPSSTTPADGDHWSVDGTIYVDPIKVETHYDLSGRLDHYEVIL